MSKEAISETVPPSAPSIKSAPPPLPTEATRPSSSRASADARFGEAMFERLAAGDYAGALLAAESLLLHQPLHADALDTAQIARSELRKLYTRRLGELDRVPRVAMGPEGLVALALDFRAGLVLARADGSTSLHRIVETCSLPELQALRILSELFLQRAIVFDDDVPPLLSS
ncbi:MAG TPA: hypothetical protein VKU41_15605 [Polyangiaceae bacterium]|nr:hypothetical protein [Polyangiaceae bacterium]